MSLCVIILERDRIFIAGDSRTSIELDGEKFAVGECNKIIKVDDMVIFRSGSEPITRHILDEFIKSKSSSMEKLQQLTKKHIQRFKDESTIDLGSTRHAEFIVARVEGIIPVIYNISSANPDNLKRIEGEVSTMFMSIGGDEQTNAMVESLNGVLDNIGLFQQVYNAHSSETIGGTMIQYYLDEDKLIEYHSPIIDSRPIKYASDAVHLDVTNGLVITRSDNKTKATFNATDGLRFQTSSDNGSTWHDSLYYNVNTKNMTFDGDMNIRGSLKLNGSEVLTADKAKIQGDYIDKIKIGQLDVSEGRITTAMIETLEVGRNVIMSPNASITWEQVVNQPNAAQLGGLMINSTRLTHIDADGVYTGTLQADQIIAGKIKAEHIDTTNLAAQKIYQQSYPSNYAKIGGQFGDFELNYNGINYFTIYNGIDHVSFKHFDNEYLKFSGAANTAVAVGKWDFSNAVVTGIHATFA
ncbi:hypothetical protein [Paenibacillus sp. PL91]|uniref:hypothetical protein n=1 Tax=Paenibacillus sp. PL91 TaxID=2729538 RepID=UPI00145CF2DD|nr:hypothetical protein [Paenibacillus sp. PL91]MBC9199807.1 hypothetical protein [Paenibacillus sp. PL91]